MKSFFLVLLVFTGIKIMAQCSSCDVTFAASGNYNNYTFQSNKKYCISGNVNFGSPNFQNNTSICIATTGQMQISNSPNSVPTNIVYVDVHGTLTYINANQLKSSLKIHVFPTGAMYAGTNGSQNLTFQGNAVEILNEGIFRMSVLGFDNNNANNIFENVGEMTITSNINVSNLTAVDFKNTGTFRLNGHYANNAKSVIVNCGNMYIGSVTVGGGKLINTKTLNILNDISISSPTTRIENYGTFNGQTITGNNNGYVFFNVGVVNLNRFNNNVRLFGPGSTYPSPTEDFPDYNFGPNYGRFIFASQSSNNSSIVTGRLNLVNRAGSSTPSAMFSNLGALTIGPNVVFGNCPTCNIVSNFQLCPNADGSWNSSSPNCIPVNRQIRTNL